MIKHIVLWKLQEEAEGHSKNENASLLRKKLKELKNLIPEIIELEVGLPGETGETISDVALYSSFKDKAGLATYQKHPEHLKVVDFVKKIVLERRVADYEI